MADQQLLEEIVSLFKGSFHGRSNFMRRMKLESQEVQAEVKVLLQSRGVLVPTPQNPPRRSGQESSSWELAMSLDELVSIHLHRAGGVNSWFVQNFKRLSIGNQDLVNARLVAIGHEPYYIKGDKRPRSPRATRVPLATTPPKVMTAEEQEQAQQIDRILQQLQADRRRVREFLTALDTTINQHGRQLSELRGIPYIEQPVYDPYQSQYKPAHAHAHKHRAEIEASTLCGCFFCRCTFAPGVIFEWCDGDQTALCPRCGVDAVLGDKSGFPISEEFLLAMFQYWFSIPLRIRAGAPDVTEIIKNVKEIAGTKKGPVPALPSPVDLPPKHLAEEAKAGVGASLINRLGPDEDDEEEEEL